MSAGEAHTCAVSTEGVVKCWGDNTYGQLGNGTAPSAFPVEVNGLPPVDQVSAGHNHTCALTTTGGVKCWGRSDSGQLGDGGVSPGGSTPVDVVGLGSGVVALASGGWHTCAITAAGAVKCWGSDSFGQLGGAATESCFEQLFPGPVPCSAVPIDVAGIAGGAIDVAAGFSHSCAAMAGGGVKCWGRNHTGQLGDGTFLDRDTPVDVGGLSDSIVEVSASFWHTCALNSSDGLECWGANFSGQLGDGTQLNRTQAVDVSGMTSGVAAVELGYQHSCAILLAGTVRCWGDGALRQLGTNVDQSSLPLDVTGINDVISISGGDQHTCAVTAAGSVYCWGFNLFGRLGDGTGINFSARPVPVLPLGSSAVTITSGLGSFADGPFNCVVTTASAAKCWGDNTYGQLGRGLGTGGTTPLEVSGLGSGTVDVSTSGTSRHACAVTSAGGVRCWGINGAGQLGIDSDAGPETCPGPTPCSRIPLDVVGLTSGVASVAIGESHTCAVTTAGGAKCWGANNRGQVGDGTQVRRLTPANVAGLATSVASISAGAAHSCAVTTDDGVKCWGDNGIGQLGDGTLSGRTTPVDVSGLTSGVAAVAAGQNHTCALTTTGGVKCWGSGPLGSETTELCFVSGEFVPCSTTPVDVSGLTSGVAAVSSGASHACALLATGAVKCWGSNGSRLGDGSLEDSLVPVNVVGLNEPQAAVSAGATQTCALSVTGVVSCWGRQAGLREIRGHVSPVLVVDASAKPTPTFTPCAPEGCPTATNTPTPTPTPLPGPQSEMLLNIKGGSCNDSERPTTCDVLVGGEFLLSVDAVAVPSSGYILMQTFVYFGGELTYNPTQLAIQEIRWPECQSSTALRAQVDNTLPPVSGGNNTDEAVNHGCLTGLFSQPLSMYVGNLVEMSFTCSAEPTSNKIDLLPMGDPHDSTSIASTSGSKFTVRLSEAQNDTVFPKLSGLTVNCVESTAVGGVALDSELAPLGALEAGEQRSRVWGSWLAGALVVLLGLVLVSAMVDRRLRSRS
ncbi:MAG: hypothetical protein IH865_07910 [Chloroflexi bacterium]|nr:hypothetical protein [Chloroflexota bacterium]